MAGPVDLNRLTFTVGKYSVVDIFDDNKYAHDSVNTFLNWTIIDMGAFDYAGDSWGYTYAATAEWKQDSWTARAGVFQLSQHPSSQVIEPVLFRQFEPVVELEERHTIQEQPGKLKFLFYANDGFMGNFDQVVAEGFATGTRPDISAVRARCVKVGGGRNLEQQITPSLGLFARLSMSTGQYEVFDFTLSNGRPRVASRSAAISGEEQKTKSVSAVCSMELGTRMRIISPPEASTISSSATVPCPTRGNAFSKPTINM